jgi:hypothetical protein
LNKSTEFNLEKKTINLLLLALIGLTTVALAIPTIAITAESDSIINLQWDECCSSENNENENSHTLSIPIKGINEFINS